MARPKKRGRKLGYKVIKKTVEDPTSKILIPPTSSVNSEEHSVPSWIQEQVNQDFNYQSNPNLKKIGVQIALTQEQIDEYIKCSEDPIYFIEKYVYFMTDEGLQLVKLYDFQKEQIKTYHENRKIIVKTSRQVGKTTVTVGYLLYYMLFNKEKTVGVLAQKEKVATEILSRFKRSYEKIPLWMQQGIVGWNATSVLLENGCRIISEATSTGALRSFTIHILYCDEFAHVPTYIADEFVSSIYPTLSSSKISKMIITSTPLGLNLFYKFWVDANKKDSHPEEWNGFVPLETSWWKVPGRTQEWANEQRRVLGERRYNQEILAEFLGSSNTLIDGKKLRELTFIQPSETLFANSMFVYERPKEGHSYTLSADPSEGKGLDYSAFTIFDITSAPYKVVAKYRDNQVEDIMFANYIKQAAEHYNNAYVIAENNAIGALVLHQLTYELDYDNIFYSFTNEHKEITVNQAASAKVPGIRTTQKLKTQGCLKLKTIIENDQVILNDFDIVSELSTFVLKNNARYAADDNYHDDMMTTLWLFAWLTAQPFFKDISDLNLRKRLFEERERQLVEALPIPPVIESPLYKKPKFEVSDGVMWIPIDVGFDEAVRILQGEDD